MSCCPSTRSPGWARRRETRRRLAPPQAVIVAPATFNTGTASNPGATQLRNTPFTGDITVSIGSFSTGGGNALRLVSDPAYLGSVTVTLSVAS